MPNPRNDSLPEITVQINRKAYLRAKAAGLNVNMICVDCLNRYAECIEYRRKHDADVERVKEFLKQAKTDEFRAEGETQENSA